MLLSLNWMREYVPYEGTVDALAHRLTMLGLEVEDIRRPFEGLAGLVVARVLTCERHPQADSLSICTVDGGLERTLTVVCGAPNVAAGQHVALAPAGVTLPGGQRIKKSKIRGAASEGMICAEDEIGLGDDHSGIMVLDADLTPGQPLAQALGLDDVVLDVCITPNRADCLSIRGLAREVAMAFGLPLAAPVVELRTEGLPIDDEIRIEIEQPELCPVYQGRVIENVRLGRSPAWMRYRLLAVGQRPLGNIVDVTNYVMFELGQPLHAFDYDRIEGARDVRHCIRVARAEPGARFTTLDGQERQLDDRDLLIWDGKRPVALAGVMGGANSEIDASSTRVFLESAVFNPANIRRTARRQSLPSEASYRFERGVDQPTSLLALDKASAMIAQLAGGVVRPGLAVAEPLPWRDRRVTLRPARASRLLGLPLEPDFCLATLQGIGCAVDNAGTESWSITAPSHRLDIEREVDLIEELGRVYGLDRIPDTLPSVGKEQNRADISEYGFSMQLKHWARGVGLREAVNYSFVGTRDLDLLGLPETGRIPVMNPLSDEQNVLRPVLGPGLLQNLRHNIAQGNDRFRLFELARVYEADPQSETTARETLKLGLLLYGGRWDENWPWPQQDADYQDCKGLIEHLLASLHLGSPGCRLLREHSWLNPCVELVLQDQSLGVVGRVETAIAQAHHARKEVWVAELDAYALMRLVQSASIAFSTLPKLPPVRRDITLVAPTTLPVGSVLEAFSNGGSSLLKEVILADVFEPGTEERNLTFRLTFRDEKRTLQDKDVDKEMHRVLNALTSSLPVRL